MKKTIPITIPEPVGPDIRLYDFEVENYAFEESELETTLQEIEHGLDKVFNEQEVRHFSYLGYQINILTFDNSNYLACVSGLVWFENIKNKERFIERLKQRYKQEFQEAMGKFRTLRYPLNIYVHVSGTRESVPVEVRARNPILKNIYKT